jgi:glucose-6-phosphate isomerase
MIFSLPSPDPERLREAWQSLDREVAAAREHSIAQLLDDEGPARALRLRLDAAGLQLDLTRQRLPLRALPAFAQLAQSAMIEAWRDAMFAGLEVNPSERRAALHCALRASPGVPFPASRNDVNPQVQSTLARMRAVSESVRNGQWRGSSGRPISDVVHVGIGGSQLGPQCACDALGSIAHPRIRIHFLGNIDPQTWHRISAELNPLTTLFIIASKSWRTPETARNAQAARDWLIASGVAPGALAHHVLAVSSNVSAACEFGIDPDHVFECPEWVGGRYSMWGAVGLPLMISIGPAQFDTMLAGARAMDDHFRSAPVMQNAPMMLALVSAWNARLLDHATEVVIPYSDRLRRLPAHLQQLQMESNGKTVRWDSSGPAHHAAMPVIWGEPGTESQHSFFQALHQGPIGHSIEFILVERQAEQPDAWQRDRALVANALAQARALSFGHQDNRPERQHPGNRPVSLIHLQALDPAHFGALVALYEHKTVTLGWLWGINPFDQWGVELGKRLAERFECLLDPEGPGGDASMEGLDSATLESLARWRELNLK